MAKAYNCLTREQAIERCETAQPNRFDYNMFTYQRWDSPTIFKCKHCGHRSLFTPETIWRAMKTRCPRAECPCNSK